MREADPSLKTECEQIGAYRKTKTQRKTTSYLDRFKKPKAKHQRKKRKCLGVLSHDDRLGEHWFMSAGPHNRVCEKCENLRTV